MGEFPELGLPTGWHLGPWLGNFRVVVKFPVVGAPVGGASVRSGKLPSVGEFPRLGGRLGVSSGTPVNVSSLR